jgi:hypothetical protein
MGISVTCWNSLRSALGPGARFLGLILVAAIACVGCSSSSPPPAVEKTQAAAPPPPAPPPPPAAKAKLAELKPIALDPTGSATVDLNVERNGKSGPIKVAVSGAPEGVVIEAVDIAEGKSAGQLKVVASEKLGDTELKAKARVTIKVADSEAEQPLEITVRKVNRPSFLPVAESLLVPGKTVTVDLNLERNGFQGPLKLSVSGLPAQITGQAPEVAADKSATKLTLTAANAPDGRHKVRVAATVYGRPVAVEVPLVVDASPYRIQSFKVVAVKPDEKTRVEVPIERRSYQGPLSLEVSGLPEGVSIAPVKVPAGGKTAVLEVVAGASAKEGVRSAQVTSVGGDLTRKTPLVVRVSHGEGFLPEEITADPQLGPLLRRGSFGGRLTAKSKQALLNAYGGTAESEAAVMRGLSWLAAHQHEDGSWPLDSYDKDITGCDCRTDAEKKVIKSDTAGTAFGLLPFLGAGVGPGRSPEEPAELAEYEEVVKRGIEFLVSKQAISKEPTKDGALDSNMYAHAVCTIALCEAYGLSAYGERGDERLRIPAQRAIKYIAQSQHKEGGWRYSPKQAGDMSATGWMFLAIRSAQLSGIALERTPLVRAERFVNSCAAGPEDSKDSRYAYLPGAEPRLSLSAAGLLTREYLGWKKDNADLLVGCKYLMENLPPESGTNLGAIYYFYYATQVLHHMEGADFDLWNYRMREHLLRSQEKEGHKAGSWNPQGTDWGGAGGRLYATSLALMTLEVYYRHLPLYRLVLRTGGPSREETAP